MSGALTAGSRPPSRRMCDCGSPKVKECDCPKESGEESREERYAKLPGVKNDTGKLRYDLVPPEAMEQFVAVLTYGAEKYSSRNWEKGIKFSRVYAALQRHLSYFWSGYDTDGESNLPALAHAICCAMFLLTYQCRGMDDFDDRPYVKARDEK